MKNLKRILPMLLAFVMVFAWSSGTAPRAPKPRCARP